MIDEQNCLGLPSGAQQGRPQYLAPGVETRSRPEDAGGEPAAELAREIGANDFLVREWLNEERLRRASARRPAGGFAEVIVEDAGAAAPDVLREAEAARRRAATICISFGDVRMEVPADLDEGTLSKFIRALRAV